MRRILGALVAIALSTTLLGGVAAPAQAHQRTPTTTTAQSYAALGDSFAAGYGLPVKSESDACLRSNLSYPELLNGLRTLKKLSFLACSGALTSDVIGGQVAALDASTRTVTLTVGGNDAGFFLLGCLQTTAGCDLAQLNDYATGALRALADPSVTVYLPTGQKVYSLGEVLAAVHAKAPHARIFLTGYPELFGERATVYGTKTACPIAVTDRAVVNTLTDKLNAVIKGSAAAARSAGIDVTYAGVTGAFDGHGLCDARTSFISTVLHPTVLGQVTYAAVLVGKGVAR
ncbi:MAG: SGNH/GDSL hydrolase family protein [Actinobacteria bacterium]|nr:SGNH/GDSL hydrolase family protein [Actinomycetota bacterium]